MALIEKVLRHSKKKLLIIKIVKLRDELMKLYKI